jgi:hypothetical protein
MLLGRLVSGALWLGQPAQGAAAPGVCLGDCFAHDPAVIRRPSDGTYFRFNTGNMIGIWKAPGLGGPWTYQGKALPGGSVINLPGNKDLWASARPQGRDWKQKFPWFLTDSNTLGAGRPPSR